jgi:hypothetical protein
MFVAAPSQVRGASMTPSGAQSRSGGDGLKLEALYRWERRIAALPMPSPLVWSALIAACLGFGVLVGKATEGTVSKRGPVMLVAAAAPAQQAPSGGSTPPPANAEETPEASSEAKGSSPAESSSSEQSSSESSSSGSTHSSTEQSSTEHSSEQKKEQSSGTPSAKLPAIKHVFVVMLSDQPYATAFGPASEAHYLTGTLEKQGTMLERYYGVAQAGLAGTIGLLAGQGPTEATAANCPTYASVAATGAGSDGQVLGQGCVYPSSIESLPTQLAAKHLTWRAYVEGQQEGTTPACAHPALGASDPSATAAAGYQTWRNPFVYLAAIASSSSCASDDVGIGALKADLASAAKTPSFAYLAPGPCQDGAPMPCAAGALSGMSAADGFLKKVVPEILASAAYRKSGLLAITVDAAPSSGEWADSGSCCGQPRFPNVSSSSGALSAAGGGQVGMLLLSPFIKKGGSLVQSTYNHFSLLATVEQLFGLPKLGYAALSEVKALSPSLFAGG